jgi:hypothetical protein
MRDHYQQQPQALTQAMADRQDWEHATTSSRQLAIAADAELRRRYPDREIEPLRSAEPAPVNDAERRYPDLIPHQRDGEREQTRDLEVQRKAFRTATSEHRTLVPSEASLTPRAPWRVAILQPPKPQITPSTAILQLTAEHDIEPEPGG